MLWRMRHAPPAPRRHPPLPGLFRRLLLGLLCGGGAILPLRAEQPITVPIYVNQATYSPSRHSIYAARGAGPLRPYLFDTGAPYFMSVLDAAGATPTETLTFASGTSYRYAITRDRITLGSREGARIAATGEIAIAAVASINGKPTTGAPLGNGTYGNFGASLYGNEGLATVLAQIPLPAGLLPGWVVDVAGRQGDTGTLTLGLTPAMLAAARAAPGAIVMPMDPTGRRLPDGRGGFIPGYNKAQVAGTVVSLTRDGTTLSKPLGTVFDTGGGRNAIIYDPSYLPAKRGTLEIRYGSQRILQFATTTPFGGRVIVSRDTSGGLRVNPGGAAIFDTYRVIFAPTGGPGGTGELILVPVR